jgi:hypothetical protein
MTMSAGVRWVGDRRRGERQSGSDPLSLLFEGVVLGLGLALALSAGALFRGAPPAGPVTPISLTAGAGGATPEQLTEAAAQALEAATAPGGTGYRFEIIQTSTMVAKPDGPKIPIPAPTGRGTIGTADRYFLNALIERGVARPDGFWSQMRVGPDEGAKPDWTGSQILYEALVRGDVPMRNDGDGWYEADALPGVGLDPDTAALLPALLRKAEPTDLPTGDEKTDPAAARNLEATAKPADIPGVVAADGAAFTELTDAIAYGFDDAGRLVRINVSALNTNMTDFDLVIETVISIAYDGVDPLPEPKPALDTAGTN